MKQRRHTPDQATKCPSFASGLPRTEELKSAPVFLWPATRFGSCALLVRIRPQQCQSVC